MRDGLVELFFARVPAQDLRKDGLRLLVDMDHGMHIPAWKQWRGRSLVFRRTEYRPNRLQHTIFSTQCD